jgi:hypothetical protein
MLKILLTAYLFYLLVAAPLYLHIFYFRTSSAVAPNNNSAPTQDAHLQGVAGGMIGRDEVDDGDDGNDEEEEEEGDDGDGDGEEGDGEEGDSEEDDDDDEEEDDDGNVALNMLWHGRVATPRLPSSIAVSIVMSHCEGNLGWLLPYISGFEYTTLTIVSKCGKVPKSEDVPDGTRMIQLPNVGRCDHTMAYWMAETVSFLPESYNDNDVILFLKDNVNIHQYAVLRDAFTVLSIASTTGFGCVLELNEGISTYHETSMLSKFGMEKYDGEEGINSNVIFRSEYENLADCFN